MAEGLAGELLPCRDSLLSFVSANSYHVACAVGVAGVEWMETMLVHAGKCY